MTNQYPFTNLKFNPSSSTIMHIDLNSCFATVEQQANPLYRGKPLAVAAYTTPNGCIIAPSVEAKRYGIKVGMRVCDGKKIFPHLIIMVPDPWKYRFINRKILALLQEYTAKITVKSIDEMVLDLVNTKFTADKIWKVAGEIKKRIRQEIGEYLTVSVGIAPNRYLAKVASSLYKPDGLCEINSQNYQTIYQKLQVENLCGIKVNNMIRLNRVGIFSVWDMYQADVAKLKTAFQSITSYYWYLRLHGYEIDDIEFTRKSFGHSYALYKATSDTKILSQLLCKLVEKMGTRLRRNNYSSSGIHIACVYSDYTFWHHGQTLTNSRNSLSKIDKQVGMYDSRDLYKQALKILLSSPIKKPVRILAVSCFNLQKNLFNQLSLLSDENKKRCLTTACDNINNRFGYFTIFPATMMDTHDKVPDRIAFGGIKELEEFIFQEKIITEPTDYFISNVYSSVQ